MAASSIPATPRVISPSPEPQRKTTTSSNTSKTSSASMPNTAPGASPDAHDRSRSRTRDRDTDANVLRRRTSGLSKLDEASLGDENGQARAGASRRKQPPEPIATGAAETNGFLSPASAAKSAGKYLKDISRSPSPLGLIPIHKDWRYFIHKHEIPRKALHVSIGFLVLYLYSTARQPSMIHPILLRMLIPIALIDLFRFSYAPFNRLYIRVLGPFMRESEAHDRFNGVIWYLLGTWTVLRFCPKDIGVVSICLLSWCDTAASTIGRAYGRYTPKLARGKSLAGSIAATIVGVGTALLFWGFVAPKCWELGVATNDTGINAFAYQGHLALPEVARNALGWTKAESTITGGLALAVMSTVAGIVASVSEAIDLWNLDDNVTIPVLAGLGLTGFLKVFGEA